MQAAGEPCPIWPGHPMTAHWGLEDPAAATGSDEEILHQFRQAMMILARRIELFADLPVASLDRLSLLEKLNHIGQH